LQVDGVEEIVDFFNKGDMSWFHTLDRGPTCSSNIPSPLINVIFPSKSEHGVLWKAVASRFQKIVDAALQTAHDEALPQAHSAGEVAGKIARDASAAAGGSESQAVELGKAATRETIEQTLSAAVERAKADVTSVESKARHFRVTVSEQLDDGSARTKTEDGGEPEVLVWNHKWRASQAAITEAYKEDLEASGTSANKIKKLVKKKAADDKHGLVHGPSGKRCLLLFFSPPSSFAYIFLF
jgi:hypothetical protein